MIFIILALYGRNKVLYGVLCLETVEVRVVIYL